ncbi:hypothetical protein NDU88_003369 [Pleurodeles waltl]|uniref:Uncharacterized protein n=1 Tax=Pleurodeles waltl TaxID=8319 RepID=A0AAV7WSW5_PLEWA|nr:hypothetical protein NDU88_003369 [Pleurodeles waltl]
MDQADWITPQGHKAERSTYEEDEQDATKTDGKPENQEVGGYKYNSGADADRAYEEDTQGDRKTRLK